jgi:hypothetical protein
VEVNDAFQPKLDGTSNKYHWVNSLDGISVPYPVQEALTRAKLV